MAVNVGPPIPTESSTAAPGGRFSDWFKNIGDWIKLMSPTGASQYDTDWVPVTLSSGFAMQGSTTPAVRRIGKQVYMRGLVRTEPAANFPTASTTILTLPAGFAPSVWSYLTTTASAASIGVRGIVKSEGTIETSVSGTTPWISLSGFFWAVE